MIAIIDYGMGNLGSIANMLRKIGAEAVVTSDPAAIESADRLILPGVGAFAHGMESLNGLGIVPLLRRRVLDERVPILGICLGMQLFTQGSEEGGAEGLGWIEGRTSRFRLDGGPERVPHMGWNTATPVRDHPILAGLPDEPRFYFVHSYHVTCADAADRLCGTTYGYEFTSAVARDNIVGTQFHPEKSHRFGFQLLRNFAAP